MRVVISGARAPSVWRVALALLSHQVIYLNLMGWIIGSFAYLSLFLYSWALPQSSIQQGYCSTHLSIPYGMITFILGLRLLHVLGLVGSLFTYLSCLPLYFSFIHSFFFEYTNSTNRSC
jgi:hypothetical protein